MAGLVDRYAEVYNRPGLQGQPNRGALLWDSTGQSYDSAGQSAYNAFQEIVGRAPSEIELNQFIPIFQGAYTQGRAAVSNFAQLESQRPENLRKNSAQYTDQVSRVFQSMVGRAPSEDEISHFGGLMASGEVDAYTLQDFLRGTPEYQGQQDTKFRGQLSDELVNSDVKYFDRAKQSVLGQFMRNGTGQSSALDSALTDLMGQIAEKRQNYLSNLSANQYQGNKDLALGNYNNAMDQFINERNYNRGIRQNAFDQNYSRANEIGDYYRQANDYRQSQQGRDALHTRDWINLGLGVGNTAAQAYMAGKGGGAFSYLGGSGGYQPYQGGANGPYAYGR